MSKSLLAPSSARRLASLSRCQRCKQFFSASRTSASRISFSDFAIHRLSSSATQLNGENSKSLLLPASRPQNASRTRSILSSASPFSGPKSLRQMFYTSQISVTPQKRSFKWTSHLDTPLHPQKPIVTSTCSSRRPFGSTAKRKAEKNEEQTSMRQSEASTRDASKHTENSSASNSSNKNFLDRLPHLPNLSQIHRPTKEELLAAATGFWARMRIRFKWFSIRSMRPFNVDEISGFISWLLVGHVLWIVLGTTTFVSLALLAINTIFAQESLARFVGNYLTKSTGCQVVFESAIVPKWKDGVITFRNVFVSRRPGQGKANVSKGSQEIAAAAAAAAAKANHRPDSILTDPDEDTNYTQFDVSIDEVNVTLSFAKWFNSKGILQDVEVRGVRGVIDRTNVRGTDEVIDPKTFRHEHNLGDFEIDSFKLRDLLVTIHQPNGFRPFPISVYEADLPQLRKQWLFYDFMSANSMSGEFDNSLFTIHPRQTHSITGSHLVDNSDEKEPFKKQSRIRIDSLNIDHLNRGVEGPFSWIHEGRVDIVADIMFPTDTDESFPKIMADFYDRIEATVTSSRHNTPLYRAKNVDDDKSTKISNHDDKRFLVMDLRVNLNDVRAVVPLFTRDLSYVNNALIRPIVAYINSRRTFIPIQCRVVKRASDFDGSWTIFDSGLMDDLSAETYDAFARDVTDDQARMRRFRKVGLWSLQLAVQAIFMGMAGNLA